MVGTPMPFGRLTPRDQKLWVLDPPALARHPGPTSSEAPAEGLTSGVVFKGFQLCHFQLITINVWGHPAYGRCY